MSIKALPQRFAKSDRVNCRRCVACCQFQTIPVMPEDRMAGREYVTFRENGEDILMLKKNGDCHYLDPKKGCMIYDKRPAVCRTFDCADALKRNGSTFFRSEIHKAAKRIRRGLPGK